MQSPTWTRVSITHTLFHPNKAHQGELEFSIVISISGREVEITLEPIVKGPELKLVKGSSEPGVVKSIQSKNYPGKSHIEDVGKPGTKCTGLSRACFAHPGQVYLKLFYLEI